jgi:hypothetical protein
MAAKTTTKNVITSIKQLPWISGNTSRHSFQAQGATLLPGNNDHKQSVGDFKNACDSILSEYIEIANKRPGGFGLKKENGFRELVQKDKGNLCSFSALSS